MHAHAPFLSTRSPPPPCPTLKEGQPLKKKRRKGSSHKGANYSGEAKFSESDSNIVQDQISATSDCRDEVYSLESQTDTDLDISEWH